MNPLPGVIPPGQGRDLNVLGNHNCLKVTGSQTGGAYELYEQRSHPGAGVPPHMHTREDETFYVAAGQVRFQVGEESILAVAGTTVFAPRNVPHAYTIVGEEEAVLLFVVSPATLESMFAALAALPAGPPDLAQVFTICGRYGVEFVGA
ncbi:MAG: cupin domain-containing protein [Planctomycetia bacterium]|nr:cupin domain-containing protein [Planctomycetia bacterium]